LVGKKAEEEKAEPERKLRGGSAEFAHPRGRLCGRSRSVGVDHRNQQHDEDDRTEGRVRCTLPDCADAEDVGDRDDERDREASSSDERRGVAPPLVACRQEDRTQDLWPGDHHKH
jgi:hypothetical protein